MNGNIEIPSTVNFAIFRCSASLGKQFSANVRKVFIDVEMGVVIMIVVFQLTMAVEDFVSYAASLETNNKKAVLQFLDFLGGRK